MINTTIGGHQFQDYTPKPINKLPGPIKSPIQQDESGSQEGIFKTHDAQAEISIKQIKAPSSSPKSRSASFSTTSTSRSTSIDFSEYKINTLPTTEASKNEQTRLSFLTRISQSFSKFISSFAFPKSIAAQKEKALNEILDDTGNKETLETLLKKESPMSTSNWASQRADNLIREAYGKRAVETLNKIQDNTDSNTHKLQIKSDLMKAMPLLAVDDHEDTQKKDHLAEMIVGFLLDPKVPLNYKADLKKEILQGKWPTAALNNSKAKTPSAPSTDEDGDSIDPAELLFKDVDSEDENETFSPDPDKIPLMKTPGGASEVF